MGKTYRKDGWRVMAPVLDENGVETGEVFVIADGLEGEHAALFAEAPELKKKAG